MFFVALHGLRYAIFSRCDFDMLLWVVLELFPSSFIKVGSFLIALATMGSIHLRLKQKT